MATTYLTAADARTLAAQYKALPGFAQLLALDDDSLGGVLLTASVDIDQAMRYQGRRYSPTQDMEFPRIPFGSTPGVNQFGVPLAGPASLPLTPDTWAWDWDFDTGTVVVPANVKLATLYQSAWLMQPKYAQRIEAIRSGLASESIGPASENFVKTDEIPGGFTGLGDRAHRIMEKYSLQTGRIL